MVPAFWPLGFEPGELLFQLLGKVLFRAVDIEFGQKFKYGAVGGFAPEIKDETADIRSRRPRKKTAADIVNIDQRG